MEEKKKAKTPTQRAYTWCLVAYDTISELSERIKELYDSCILSHYAYIIHDKDVYLESGKNDVSEYKKGDPRPSHIHFILVFKINVSLKKINELLNFPSDKNLFGEPTKNKSGFADYLLHKNTPQKYQYDTSEVVSDNYNYFCSKIGDSENNYIVNLLNDLINQDVSFLELAKRYGRDLVINFRSYLSFANLIIEQSKNPKYMTIEELKDLLL